MKQNAIFLVALLFMMGVNSNEKLQASEQCAAISNDLIPLYVEKAELENQDNFVEFNKLVESAKE